MTRSELKTISSALEAKRADLQQSMRQREAIVTESATACRKSHPALEREFALRMLDLDANLIRHVRAALRRLEAETFGVCLYCEKDISPARLFLTPWAPFCDACQALVDGSHPAASQETFVEQGRGAADL